MTTAKKHLEKLPDDWQAAFLELYKVGLSDVEVMREYGITPTAWKTMYNSLGESEFQTVVEFGNTLAEAWWMEKARLNTGNKQFNTTLFNSYMQNRFGWSSKQETEAVNPISVADEPTLDRRLQELLAGVGKT